MSSNLLSAFLSSCTGAHLGSTIANYAAALRAWHILHGLEWNIKELEYKAILEGANKLAPSSSKRAKRAPFTVDILEKFRHAMDLDNPRDATIFACIAISFYCVARLGEFTVPAIAKFDRTKHISRADVKFTFNHENLPVIMFSLPCTKTSPEGENTHCAPHDPVSLSDPKTALDNHFRVNPAQPTDHLFAWKHPTSGLRPLSKKEVVKQIESIKKTHPEIPDLKGHSLRIGGTLHYLLKGVPFDVVKTIGRWSSESFTIYLRHHALILAPFLQQQPCLLDNFRRYLLPPIR
jgi:hypothetical protein